MKETFEQYQARIEIPRLKKELVRISLLYDGLISRIIRLEETADRLSNSKPPPLYGLPCPLTASNEEKNHVHKR